MAYVLQFVGQEWGGIELVYDFATMERANFSYVGLGFGDSTVGGGVSAYTGEVLGFRSDRDIENDYGGPFNAYQLGGSLPFIVSAGIGLIGFRSTTDGLVRGGTAYIGGSLPAADLIKILDAGYAYLPYDMLGASTKYIQNGKVNKPKLLMDIMTGNNSPWLIANTETTLMRIAASIMAIGYSKAYEELHEQ